MGRYYSGDIEGKFWFAVQSSDDAAQFGALEGESCYIPYYVDDLQTCKKRLVELFEEIGADPKLDISEDEFWDLYESKKDDRSKNDGLFASLELGLKIYKCIKENGSCSFEAEI